MVPVREPARIPHLVEVVDVRSRLERPLPGHRQELVGDIEQVRHRLPECLPQLVRVEVLLAIDRLADGLGVVIDLGLLVDRLGRQLGLLRLLRQRRIGEGERAEGAKGE